MTDTHNITLTIQNKRGLHARAAAKFVKKVAEFEGTDVKVTKGCQTVTGSSIMGLLMLAACIGSDIQVETTGPKSSEASQAIADLVNDKFGEDKDET